MISSETREMVIHLIDEAVRSGARKEKACEVIGISSRTLRRWHKHRQQEQHSEDRRQSIFTQRTPSNKLTVEEKQKMIDTCNQDKYKSLPPSQIVPILADQGVYFASESSFYRVLREYNQINRRGRAQATNKPAKPQGYKATQPNEVWSWDISYLASSVRGQFYYLYLIEDIYSRKIVGWEVHETESAEHASTLIRKSCLSESIHQEGLVLHSDNGSPMKGATMLATLQKLGIIPSFSRPSVSDDNPYSESLFRTIKYSPSYPNQPFLSIEKAREWVSQFVHWYNEQHRHSSIKFVTPNQRHKRKDIAILKKRAQVYSQAKRRNPKRWSGEVRNWNPVNEVWLNPPKEIRAEDRKLSKVS